MVRSFLFALALTVLSTSTGCCVMRMTGDEHRATLTPDAPDENIRIGQMLYQEDSLTSRNAPETRWLGTPAPTPQRLHGGITP